LSAVGLSRRTGHSSAFFRAAMTCLGTALAMFRFVLFAFSAARIANVGTEAANVLGEVRAPAHKRRGHPADFGTVPVKPDTFGHDSDILFAQAGVRTVLASLSTFHAGFDTGLVLFVGHESLSFEK